MIGINERIQELRIAAKSTPVEIPEERRYLENLADDLEWEKEQYALIVQRVREVADPRWLAREKRITELRRALADFTITRAGENELQTLERNFVRAPRVALELNRHADLQQILNTWCAELKLAGLLTQVEENRISIQIPPSPRRLEEMKQEQAAIERLKKMRDEIIATIPPDKRREALTCWNEIDGFIDAEKLEMFVEALRRKKLLGEEWLPQRAARSLLRRLLHSLEPVSPGIFLK